MKVKDAAMQAFPFIEPSSEEAIKAYHPGMGLRDFYAGPAMQVLIQNEETDFSEDAEAAFLIADAMLKARRA